MPLLLLRQRTLLRQQMLLHQQTQPLQPLRLPPALLLFLSSQLPIIMRRFLCSYSFLKSMFSIVLAHPAFS
jgi:hypothetical protein